VQHQGFLQVQENLLQNRTDFLPFQAFLLVIWLMTQWVALHEPSAGLLAEV